MSETIASRDPGVHLGGGGGGTRFPGGFGDYGQGGGLPPGTVRRVHRTGMWLALFAISMLFISFTSAYIVRSGMGNDWLAMEVPPLAWLNTVILLFSSLAMERSRRALEQGLRDACNRWITITALLGALFLAGQVIVWQQLVRQGIYMATNPSSSFFYLLTGAHGVHLFGGLIALFYLVVEAWRYRLGPAKRTLVEVTAMYWHFMDGLWVYLVMLIWLWR